MRTAAMRRSILAIAAAALCSTAAAPTNGAGLLDWTGTVDRVVDGDTVQVDIAGDGTSGVHVRNAGIQAMEKGQCGAAEATKALASMVEPGQSVVLRASYADSTSTDGTRVRPLRYLDLPSGLDVQLELLRRGLVLAYPLGAREIARQDEYHRAAQEAAQQGIGLYSRDLCGEGPRQKAQLRVWVNWDADGNDADNVNGEYVRILNEGGKSVDVSGWWLRSPTNARYTFPPGTSIPAGRHLTLHSGSGSNTATDHYWGGTHGRFYNVKPDGVHSFGAYLFDPDGDLRFWSMYPCTWGCWEPLSTISNVSWTADYNPPGDERTDPNLETVSLTNTSTQRIDASYRVVTLLGRVLEFGRGTYLDPGETLRVHMGRGSEKRLHKYLGSDKPQLNNAGGSVVLRNAQGVQIGCARWGDGGPATGRCTPTAARSIERAELTTDDLGLAMQLAVVPSGGRFDYELQRWDADRGWAQFSTGTTPTTGSATLEAPAGRYRVVIPRQSGYSATTSSAIDLVPRPDVTVTGGPSALWVAVKPDPTAGGWAVRVERQDGTQWTDVAATITGPDGTVSLPVPEGTYRVVVPAAGDYARAVSSSVKVGQDRLRASLAPHPESVGTIKVNVNPNRPGTSNWSFELQRRSGTSWERVGVYQTSGAAETASFRYLPSGTYRVQLPAQSGALAGVSPALDYSAPHATLSLRVIDGRKLRVNAGPALPGTKDFSVKIQRRSGGRWVAHRTVSTEGKAERVTVNVPRGTYRARLAKQRGYLGVVSAKRFVAR